MSKCRSCDAEIMWVKTKTGKNMPINYDPELVNEKEFDADRMESHFSTCPDANQFKKRS